MALALTISGMQARSQSSVKAEPLSVTLGGCCLQTLLSACHSGKKIISILPGALKLKECEMYCEQISHKKEKIMPLYFFSSLPRSRVFAIFSNYCTEQLLSSTFLLLLVTISPPLWGPKPEALSLIFFPEVFRSMRSGFNYQPWEELITRA